LVDPVARLVSAVLPQMIERQSGRILLMGSAAALRGQRRTGIEAGVIQSTSRALFEEVTFDSRNVTSVDWAGYPILDIRDAPESVEVVLINRPDLPPYSAGEPCTRTVPAAIANAIFDATGVRMRRVPLSPADVKAALVHGPGRGA
jgi:CO/xanthine dehydrogenase Mo-binding subunit